MRPARIGPIVQEKHELGASAAAQADTVAMLQRALGHLRVVHERSVARPAVFEHVLPVFAERNFRVLARHVLADRTQITLALAPDAEDRLIDDNLTPAERVVDLQAWGFVRCCCRGHSGLAFSTPISTSMPVKS